jgi:hypothetical protein
MLWSFSASKQANRADLFRETVAAMMGFPVVKVLFCEISENVFDYTLVNRRLSVGSVKLLQEMVGNATGTGNPVLECKLVDWV